MIESRGYSRRIAAKIYSNLNWLLAIALSVGVAGCSLFGSDDNGIQQKVVKEVWHSRDSYVRIETQDAPKGVAVAPNSQPVNIESDQIRNALDSIQIKPAPKEGAIPLFTEYELDQLSSHLAEGLAEAGPNQDVTFAIEGWHKGLLALKVPRVTTGRVFYANGQLNLILGAAQRDANDEDPYYREMDSDRRLDPYTPGMRSFTIPHKWTLAVPPNSGVYSASNTSRTDWLVFSTQALATPPPGSRTAEGKASQQRYDQLRQEVERLRQDLQGREQATPGAPAHPPAAGYPGYYPSAPAYPAYPAYPAPPGYPPQAYPPQAYPPQAYPQPAAPQSAVPQAPAGQAQESGSVAQRLMVLDDLKNKGLISDAEYQQKRSQILAGY